MSAWKAREFRKAAADAQRKQKSLSQAKRLEEDREKREIRETHRRLREEFLARDERRRAA